MYVLDELTDYEKRAGFTVSSQQMSLHSTNETDAKPVRHTHPYMLFMANQDKLIFPPKKQKYNESNNASTCGIWF